jgi:hypothetical protein
VAQSPSISQGGIKLQTSPNATKVAYYDGDYVGSLKHMLLGITNRDDIPISIGGTWEAIGTATTTSPTITFVVSNFSTSFNVYWIQLVGALASGSTTSFGAEWSTDNGDTAITHGSKYNFQYTTQLTSIAPTAPVSGTGAGQMAIPTTLGSATTHRRGMNMLVFDPANANTESSILYSVYTFDRAFPFTTQFGRGWGTHRDKAAHNAIRLNINNVRTWTGGTINVWGQAV